MTRTAPEPRTDEPTPPTGSDTHAGGSDAPPADRTVAQTPDAAARAAVLSAEKTRPPGASVPGYEILGELGRGGMGVVYKARQVGLGRVVALKMVLARRDDDPVAHARFQIEAEAVAALDHPHVVKLFEFGRHDDLPYLAMEFVAGESFAARLRRDGRLPPREAAATLAAVAEGVAAAHAAGIVHRDLKPGNILLTPAGEPKVADFGLAKRGPTEMTATEAVMGTPSYMAPEQASGKAKFAGPAADVWALGVIFYECLTGERPFRSPDTDVLLALIRLHDPDPPRRAADAPRDLDTICLKCLEKDPRRRYATARELADDLRAFLDGRPIAARPVGPAERAWKWVRRHPGRAAVVAAGLALTVGLAAASNEVSRQREADRIAAEGKRLADLREADADALVRSLAAADTAIVPRVLDDLAGLRDLARPGLLALADQPITAKPGLHARLALLPDDPGRAAELAAYLPACRPEELPPIRDALKPHAGAVAPGLWAVLGDPTADPGRRARAASALAGLAPDDGRWADVAPAVADAAVRASPAEFVVWAAALEPVCRHLLPPLTRRYPESRRRIESGRLESSALVAEAAGFDLTAALLARYIADRPAELAELAVTAHARHHRLLAPAVATHRAAVFPILRAEADRIGRVAVTDPTAPAWLQTVAGAVPGEVRSALAKRGANAAAVLLASGEPEAAWPLFRHSPDPTARSYLVERAAGIGVDPVVLIRRFDAEADVSARRALVLALGDYPAETVPAAEREAFVARLLSLYRDDPDPGLHSAIDWVLRRRWGKAEELRAIDARLATEARGRLAARAVLGAAPLPAYPGAVGRLLPVPPIDPGKAWFVNGEGLTFAVVRGPVEFTLGSPPTEPGRIHPNETPHRKRIPRTFALATREVSVADFQRFRPAHAWVRRFSPGPDTPVVSVTWYDAAAYCNWLSAREGIPPDQWCYIPNKAGQYAAGMAVRPGHVGVTGYRLPTEAEWECACRAGTTTARYCGRPDELLPRYAWYIRNGDDRTWPCGLLRPNDLGLFDALGNALEWVGDPARMYVTGRVDDAGSPEPLVVEDHANYILRGGSFGVSPDVLRSAVRVNYRPGDRFVSVGFRPARTLPD